ncbi:dipeptidyl-peptidase-4 [Cyclobacterium lianum]|uniref:Dipeptidyl-peptidase-4 n=1 Tax=Cyclobacterium lianum TaxID=388280 RepID=A0A1M7NX41_9BACT|nr:S9 family peptidase [Cyclobacterium lianum]SHN08787.1 dipeptidyl-peptidase-4 [Cyclobacterium lianum]
MKKIVFLITIFFTFAATVFSQSTLSLEQIYAGENFRQKQFGPVRWMKDAGGYSSVLPNQEGEGEDIVRYDAASNSRTTLVSAAELVPEGLTEPLHVADYHWSADNSKLLVFTNTRKVWRYHTRGDYWVLDQESRQLRKLGKGLPGSSLMFAKFSPDASRVAYVSEHNIYVESLRSGEITQLTTDGGEDIINGTFDWVYEEELGCRDGFRWSPDGESIAYWHSDTRDIGTFYLINNIDSIYSRPIPLPYPKVGEKLSAVKVGLVSANGGESKWFDIPGDPQNNYLARMDFIPGSDELLIQQLNRRQNTNTVWIADSRDLSLSPILKEKDDAFLDIHDNLIWLEDEQFFTWTSERDGWRHLYKVSRSGDSITLLTKGDFDVERISHIDPAGGYVYYIASPDNFTQRYLYRSRLDQSGSAERITPMDQPGQHSYQISPDARFAIHSFQNAGTPPVISLVDLPAHNTLRVLESNQSLKDKYNQLGLSPKEFFKVDIGEVVLDAFMIRPANFDPVKKYPLICYVYGEPAGATVQDSWMNGDLWHQYLSQLGYVVISIDNRGTKTPRGRDWRKSIYGQIGILAAKDQYHATKQILSTYDFIDSSRVGIWGWSGGGQMTLNCMFRYPELYKTGIAVAFVSDQRLYDATYQERYMGLLGENESGYFDGSPINHAGNLEGNLLIMHGTADDNVHYQSYEMLVDKLIAHDKLFSMMSYPMRAHGINERENTSLHLRRTMEKFWLENLAPGGR